MWLSTLHEGNLQALKPSAPSLTPSQYCLLEETKAVHE